MMDVPFGKRSTNFGREVGKCLGVYLEVDDSNPLFCEEFMRINVMVDITKPLRRGIMLVIQNGLVLSMKDLVISAIIVVVLVTLIGIVKNKMNVL